MAGKNATVRAWALDRGREIVVCGDNCFIREIVTPVRTQWRRLKRIDSTVRGTARGGKRGK